MRPTSLARSSSSDGRVASAFTPSGFRAVLPIAPPRITSLSLALAKSTATFGRRDRIARVGDQGRTGHQVRDRGDVGAFESDLGEAVLGDLHGGAGLLHLRAQLLHFGDRKAGVVGNDDHRGLGEDLVERRDELSFSCSVHWALSGWRGPKGKLRRLHLSPKKSTRPGLRAEPSWTTLSQALSPISAKNAAEFGRDGSNRCDQPPEKGPGGEKFGLPRLCRPGD